LEEPSRRKARKTTKMLRLRNFFNSGKTCIDKPN